MATENPLSPPQSMAVAYAPSKLRPALALLLEFDNRLMGISSKGQEPLLKRLRLAWWREQLAKPPESRPRGEPLLGRLADCEWREAQEQRLHQLVDAWEMLIALDGSAELQEMDEANKIRGDAIFAGYANLADSREEVIERAKQAGLLWAQASLGFAFENKPLRLIPGLKPLNLLLMSVAIDTNAGGISRFAKVARLNWHALTGR